MNEMDTTSEREREKEKEGGEREAGKRRMSRSTILEFWNR